MQVTVYLDLVFLINMFCNFMVLVSEGWFLKNIRGTMRIHYIRLLLAAAAGGTGYCIHLITGMQTYLKAVAALFLALGMVRYSFGRVRITIFLGRVLLFFLLSFGFSGFLRFVLGNKPGGMIEILCFGGVLLFFMFLMALFIKNGKRHLICVVWLEHNGKHLGIKGLWDTGNQLKDPLSGKPVFLLEYGCARELFLKEEAEQLDAWIFHEVFPEQLLRQLHPRLVIYSSVGKERGMLPAVVLEKIRIDEGDGELKEREGLVVALVNRKLGKDYQMILPEKY